MVILPYGDPFPPLITVVVVVDAIAYDSCLMVVDGDGLSEADR